MGLTRNEMSKSVHALLTNIASREQLTISRQDAEAVRRGQAMYGQ